MRHVVEAVRYTSGSEGWVTCTCGEVTAITDYPAHRRMAGERSTTAGGRSLGPTRLDVTARR